MYITEKGYAFVTMADDNGAAMAVKELNGSVVDGQEIKVDNAHSNDRGERRGGGGGGYRGRSFGRGNDQSFLFFRLTIQKDKHIFTILNYPARVNFFGIHRVISTL